MCKVEVRTKRTPERSIRELGPLGLFHHQGYGWYMVVEIYKEHGPDAASDTEKALCVSLDTGLTWTRKQIDDKYNRTLLPGQYEIVEK